MAKKGEVAIQKKDEHELRNPIIVGLVIAVLSYAIALLLPLGGAFKPPESPPTDPLYCQACMRNYTSGEFPQCPGCWGDTAQGLDQRRVLVFGILPTLMTVYLILGSALYLVSLKLKTKFNLRFWAKSIVFAGIWGFFLAILAPIIVNTIWRR